jgi:hypothetical protein
MITTSFANNILKYFFCQSDKFNAENTGECYLGLSMTPPNADGSNFTEPDPDTTGYQRKQICILSAKNYTNLMSEPANGFIENTQEITFNEAKENYPSDITHFGIFHTKDVRDGIPLYTHPLTKPNPNPETGEYEPQSVSVSKDEVLIFRKGALSLNFAKD